MKSTCWQYSILVLIFRLIGFNQIRRYRKCLALLFFCILLDIVYCAYSPRTLPATSFYSQSISGICVHRLLPICDLLFVCVMRAMCDVCALVRYACMVRLCVRVVVCNSPQRLCIWICLLWMVLTISPRNVTFVNNITFNSIPVCAFTYCVVSYNCGFYSNWRLPYNLFGNCLVYFCQCPECKI